MDNNKQKLLCEKYAQLNEDLTWGLKYYFVCFEKVGTETNLNTEQ